ncbi:zinc finger BED domain-containing protein RICESLEEPER 2-like [Senna tora]|uniref:Zinc finger BED domain-containing protein RICESLEEPER 2-like n=1 Tax=Senna tora TaxID=362788 RepID=A0A834WIH7_9FABA|nr:zinc finger BED domain-containing protein RICESLEEPER 2-like [Senna tora]
MDRAASESTLDEKRVALYEELAKVDGLTDDELVRAHMRITSDLALLMTNPNNEQSQEQGQTQAPPPTPASPLEATTTATSASAPATNSTIVVTKRKPLAHKSTVWDHFDKLPVDENNLEARARCRVEIIGKAIEKCLLGWGIENVFSITVDNASSNDTTVTYLKKRMRNWNGLVCDGDFLHVRCCAHILNLVVNDELRDLHYSIGAIRNVVRSVRSSPARLARFKGFVEKEKIKTKSLVCLDDSTRVFYSIIVRLYVMSNACFYDIAHVQTMLKASIAHRKYDKYWGYKLDYVNSNFEDIYDDLQECETMKKNVRDTLDRLYEQYSVRIVNESVEHPQESGESNTTPGADGLSMPDFVNTNPKGKWWSKKKNNATDQKSDLEKYLVDEIHDNDNNFDIVAWWKVNANKYKILSLIARDVLVVPVSTVASESAFSKGGRLLDVQVQRCYLSIYYVQIFGSSVPISFVPSSKKVNTQPHFGSSIRVSIFCILQNLHNANVALYSAEYNAKMHYVDSAFYRNGNLETLVQRQVFEIDGSSDGCSMSESTAIYDFDNVL